MSTAHRDAKLNKTENVRVVGADFGVPTSALPRQSSLWCSPVIPVFVQINQDPCRWNLKEFFQKGGCPGMPNITKAVWCEVNV